MLKNVVALCHGVVPDADMIVIVVSRSGKRRGHNRPMAQPYRRRARDLSRGLTQMARCPSPLAPRPFIIE